MTYKTQLRHGIFVSASIISLLSGSFDAWAARPTAAELKTVGKRRYDSRIQNKARELRFQRLEGIRGAVKQTALSPGEPGRDFIENVTDRKRVLFNQDQPLPKGVKGVRSLIAPVFKNEQARLITVDKMQQEIRRLSEDAKARFEGSEPVYFDEVVIGMGPQGAAYVQEKTTSDPNRKVLIIDEAALAGGTFGTVGSVFNLNSTNRKNDGNRAGPGRGDLNRVHDIVGLPDLRGGRWVEAGLLGEVTATGVYLSSATPMLETRLKSISLIGKDGKALELVDTRDGRKFTVAAKKVVIATGLGDEFVPFKDPETKALIERELARPEPRIQTFKKFVEKAAEPGNRQPLRDVADKTLMLVGGGDSGKVLAELLTGIGPEAAYKDDVAQVGQPRKIFWFLGEDGFQTCKEFLDGARARYSRIAQALNSGLLVPVAGRVLELKETADGGYKVKYQYRDRNGNLAARSEEISYNLPADARLGRGEKRVREDVTFDRVILATGFNDRIPGLIEPLLKQKRGQTKEDRIATLKDGSAWKKIKVGAREFDTKVSIARELNDVPGIFLAGSANEKLGGLPEASELKGINENTVSLFANIGRTEELARYNATEPLSQAAKNDARSDFQPALREDLVLTRDYYSRGLRAEVFSGEVRTVALRPSENPELALRAALDDLLRNFTFKTSLPESMEIAIERAESPSGKPGYRFTVNSSRGLFRAEYQLKELLLSQETLNDVLLNDYLSPRSRVQAIKVRVPVNSSTGAPNTGKLEVTAIR